MTDWKHRQCSFFQVSGLSMAFLELLLVFLCLIQSFTVTFHSHMDCVSSVMCAVVTKTMNWQAPQSLFGARIAANTTQPRQAAVMSSPIGPVT